MVKIATGSIEGFVKAPPSEIRAVLCYGPDAGLARERMRAVALTVAPDLEDPFQICDLSSDTIKADPAILGDEAAAISMMGGRRVILIRDASDACADALAGFLEDPVGDALIVLSAGDLPAKSKLRKVFEGSKLGAAIACYLDEAGGIDRLIEEGLRPLSVRIEPEAREFLVDNLGSDRGVSRSEIEKLALYAGQNGTLDFDTVSTLIGDSSVSTLDDVIQAMAEGNSRSLDRALDLAAQDGTAPVALLRTASNHMLRLRRVQDLVSGGMPLQGAMSSLRPPVFYKSKARFEAGVKRWPPLAVAEALSLLIEAEAACKRSGAPDWILCHRSLHQVGALARRHASGRRASR
ncbi:DNA polymerase III subunit delta [Hwanghaeella sp. LZ110]|jgi:DNA polymerase III subunit delta|uniref:DNA polymerase III subunit delta n=1 Tax=Hwanghaeella sp. LZ110 TaxID=3402810 RepID=UPI003B67B8EB